MEPHAATSHYQRGFRENNEMVAKVASDNEVAMFDFAKVMPTAKEYWFDGRHLDESGALTKAELFADYLNGSGLLDETHAQAGGG